MKTQTKNWKTELARDFLALGSWVFFILVIARAFIKPYRPFLDQIIIAGIILILINIFVKKSDNYIARGLILVIFTILFYEDNIFTTFAITALIGLILSSLIIENNKTKIIKGITIGIICSIISYYLAPIFLVII